MFERFTERARQVVVLAQEESRALQHNHIGTEHILLGLLRVEDDITSRALAATGLALEEVRAHVEHVTATGDEPRPGQIPFTPRAKKVLELSLREALALGHNYIGTEHVLLGLLRERDGVAVRVLRELDADPDLIREQVLRLVPAAEHQVQPAEGVAVRLSESRFTVAPDRELRRLLMAAAGRALAAGREEYGLADLRAAEQADREPPEAPAPGL